MPKKIIQNTFSKIIFLIFIFSFIQFFLMKEKSYAFKVATTTPECTATTTTQTLYVVSDTDRTGTLPICYSDTLNESVFIYLNDDRISTNKVHSASTTGTFQYYNHNITLPLNKSETFFILKDVGNQTKNASFDLTLLPATIGMTVSTSTAGYDYNAAGTAITGSYNDTISQYLGPYQLKYGEQLNFSCDKTTKMAVYSSAKNNTSPLLKDLSASNYSSNQILKNLRLYVFICFY